MHSEHLVKNGPLLAYVSSLPTIPTPSITYKVVAICLDAARLFPDVGYEQEITVVHHEYPPR